MRALLRTGLPKSEAAGLGSGPYAFVLGFALRPRPKASLMPLNLEEEASFAPDPGNFQTPALLPAFAA